MKIDKDSHITILWIDCLITAVAAAGLFFIHNLFISIPLAVFLMLFAVFVVWFHRVPDRTLPQLDEKAITSVADGKVVIVEKVFEKEYLKKECVQISVYMDFFDVHTNFWPLSGEITYYKYHPGKYLLAFLPKASEENEHSSTAIRNDHGEIFFKQIAGTFARRIVCYSKEGANEERGAQCGIIKFGSRIDLFLPLDAEINVKVGDFTRACQTVIGRLK